MKNIIVPIDFSEESIRGLKIAFLFAKQQHTNIQLVYVKKKSNDYRSLSYADERSYAEKRMDNIIAKFSPLLENGSSLRYIIKKGKIFDEVVSQAKSYKNSIITMSTHGASGFEELFIGSNASKIISATELPVITINKGECPETIKKIILPIDISPKSRQKVSYTAEMARVFKAEIHVVSVSSSQGSKILARLDAYNNQVSNYLSSLKLKVERDRLIGENITDLTIKYAKEVNGELISIMTDVGSNFSLFSSSYADQMLNKSNCLVLNITPKVMGQAGSFSTFGG